MDYGPEDRLRRHAEGDAHGLSFYSADTHRNVYYAHQADHNAYGLEHDVEDWYLYLDEDDVEGETPAIQVRLTWDRVNGDFDSEVTGSDAVVAVVVVDRETGDVLYGNDVSDPD